MESLQNFRASDNDFTGEIPSDMGKMVKLEYLYLEGNDFDGPVPSALGELTKLKLLHLNDNNVSGVMPPEVCKLVDSFFLSDLKADCDGQFADITCTCCSCN